MINIHSELISGAINSIYHAIAWSKPYDIIAYSCSNQIFLYNPAYSKVFASLPTPSKRANAIEFMENFEHCILVSTDSAGGVSVWESVGDVFFLRGLEVEIKGKYLFWDRKHLLRSDCQRYQFAFNPFN